MPGGAFCGGRNLRQPSCRHRAGAGARLLALPPPGQRLGWASLPCGRQHRGRAARCAAKLAWAQQSQQASSLAVLPSQLSARCMTPRDWSFTHRTTPTYNPRLLLHSRRPARRRPGSSTSPPCAAATKWIRLRLWGWPCGCWRRWGQSVLLRAATRKRCDAVQHGTARLHLPPLRSLCSRRWGVSSPGRQGATSCRHRRRCCCRLAAVREASRAVASC